MSLATAADKSVEEAQEKIVHSYVAAFNAHDVEAMLKMVTDDIQWLSIDGEKITKETNNKEELRNGMVGYFKSCGSCKSRIAHIFATGSRVSALEVASYETSKGVQEQQSVSLYEFSGALIRRVYYFPVEN
ncbi:nuclear transport factor 2 family protein [Pseudoalteromonas mariniglutinosa]|uniref:nuclear transport factor 2 family protein n=1 Tax=Pseudoalteromonas mariniglutinosa TaxID=206042 RepID=UPI00384E6844